MTIPYNHSTETLLDKLRAKSLELGFSTFRVTSLDDRPDFSESLYYWLNMGYHGTMSFMEERKERRSSPYRLWPEAKSAFLFGLSYQPDTSPFLSLYHPGKASLATYAKRRDYHDVLKGKLKLFADYLHKLTQADIKLFVDTGLLMEKPLAQRAGIGWQGKHSVIVSRHHGPWIYLGALLTNVTFPSDKPETDHCGSCRKCLDICPTQAFIQAYKLDARRCIAYLTVEYKHKIPVELRHLLGNRIFGCDDCVAICPWNRFAKQCSEIRMETRQELESLALKDLLLLDDINFRKLFSATPVKRIGRNRFIRNVLVASGNSKLLELVEPVQLLLQDESSLVRAMAVWALHEIHPEQALKNKKIYSERETNLEVLEEWSMIKS